MCANLIPYYVVGLYSYSVFFINEKKNFQVFFLLCDNINEFISHCRLKVCDDEEDCADGSDEHFCASSSRKSNALPATSSSSDRMEDKAAHSHRGGAVRPVPTAAPTHGELEAASQIRDAQEEQEQQEEEDLDPRRRRGRGRGRGRRVRHELRVYPARQRAHEGADAVLQCRDEGPARAAVRWRRRDRRRLPGGSRSRQDARGRLTLWRLRPKDAGEYECYVVGEEEGEEDARKVSRLEVKRRRRRYRHR